MRHMDNMAKITLATSMMVGYSYMTEFFIAGYSGDMCTRRSPSTTAPWGRIAGAGA